MALILFEDEHLLAVNKPAGWNTHAPSPFAGEGVFDWLRNREPRWANLAIIHRLDKETSGVLLFAKSVLANKSLTDQFTRRAVQKRYLLATDRPVRPQSLTALSCLTRAGQKYVSRPVHVGGDRAETRFRVISAGPRPTLLEAEPLTGRTHQIRVHAAEHGFPILGDVLYGGSAAARVFLHAASLELEHPASKQRVVFEAPCPWRNSTFDDSANRRLEHSTLPLRAAVIELQQTDSYRVIHGQSDGWPGLYVDTLGHYLLCQQPSEPDSTVQTGNEAAAKFIEHLAATLDARGVYQKMLTRRVRGTKAAESSPRLVTGEATERFTTRENGLTFEMSFADGYSIGLFLDQRDNRRRLLMNYVGAAFGPVFSQTGDTAPEVLNVFAYTCAFSVAAARAGARVTSLDLSKKYLEWGKRNFTLNGLDPAQHDFIYGDAFDWLRRLAKKGRLYDVVILDPPTFSQSKESGLWQAEKDYARLISFALPLVKQQGVLFASTNASRLEPERFVETITSTISKAGRRTLAHQYIPQPPDFPISRGEPAYLKTFWVRVA